MRTASLRTTLVGVFLAATLSGTAPDIFVRCAARGRPGGPLLVEGGAQLICELSGALKKVEHYAEKYHRTHGFSCTGPAAERVKNAAHRLAREIDNFVLSFEGDHYGSTCLISRDTPRNSAATVGNNELLKGCRSSRNNIRNAGTHGDVTNELDNAISKFTAVGSSVSWENGVSSVFGTNTRGQGCPLTLHKASMDTRCVGKLDEYGKRYGGLWEIRGEHYSYCSEHDCSCQGYYSPEPKIYWIGDGSSYDAEMLRTLREDLKTLNEAGESKCASLHTALSTHTQTHLHENNDNDNSGADTGDDVGENADSIETEQHTGGSSGSTDTNATVVSENYGDSRARSETGGHSSSNNDSNPMRASTDNNASTVPAQNSPLYADIHISSNCHLGGVIFMFAGVFFGKTFIFSPHTRNC
ncbi:putative variant surface glycoprotein, (VSG) [Trypanosoma vivax]|nr:putative variant surface glycoprotein, (VSG) [Trypanosoma vivax]